MVRYLYLVVLLAVFTKAQNIPVKPCDPNVDCDAVIKKQEYGVDVLLRNFQDPQGYFAFVIDNQSANRQEYLVCVPHEQRRMRALSLMGMDLIPLDKFEARQIRKVGENDFVCTFNHRELTNYFRRQTEVFTVVGRSFDNKFHDISFKTVPILPISEHISAIPDGFEDVLTPDEKKMTTDLLGRVHRIGAKKDDEALETMMGIRKSTLDKLDKELEEMLEGEKKFSTRRREEEAESSKKSEEEDDEEDYVPRRRGRPTRLEEEVEDEDYEETTTKKSNNNRKKTKESKKKEEEAIEDIYDLDFEHGDFEDEKKSSSHNFSLSVLILLIGLIPF